MSIIGKRYLQMLHTHCGKPLAGENDIVMFSSVTGRQMDEPADAAYWLQNMVSI
jgi:hypothetical protein